MRISQNPPFSLDILTEDKIFTSYAVDVPLVENYLGETPYFTKKRVALTSLIAPILALYSFGLFLTTIVPTPLSLQKRALLHSKHATRDLLILLEHVVTGTPFPLIPAINTHRLDQPDLYLHPPISLKGRTIEFFQSEGLCGGATLLFNRLAHLASTEKRSSVSKAVFCVAQAFSKGVMRGGALIQSVTDSKVGEMIGKLGQWNSFQRGVLIDEHRAHSTRPLSEIGWLKEGIFYLRCGAHALSFVGDGSQFFLWDSAWGLIKIKTVGDLQTHLLRYEKQGEYAFFIKQTSFLGLCYYTLKFDIEALLRILFSWTFTRPAENL